MESGVETVLFFLYSTAVRDDLHSWASSHHKIGNYLCFLFVDVLMPKEELPIQVSEVNGVHVDEMNFSYTTQGQIFNNLAAESTCPYHQYFL